jgi:RNA ligase
VLLLDDLLDPSDLAEAIEQGYVREQFHPSIPLRILNYTERAAYERVWTDITRQCRGLIVNTQTGVVAARPFPKFFNYGEHPEGSLDLTAPADVTDKLDGSLGILYPDAAGWAIATRGSFASEQAQHATALMRDEYPEFEPPEGMTVLFEIIFPANRIVVDYGGMDDLVLLGAVDIATGAVVGPDWLSGWHGPAAETFQARTLAEALALPPRPGREGVVVRTEDGTMVKLKQDDYVALHRILTMTTARTVWEYLAVDACNDLITAPKHWGSRLSLDPVRAAEILAVGPDWMARLTEGVPDEFHGWLRSTIGGILAKVDGTRADLETEAAALIAAHGTDRKAFAQAAAGRPHAGAMFLLLDGRDITPYLWKAAYPPPEKAWGARSEDVA